MKLRYCVYGKLTSMKEPRRSFIVGPPFGTPSEALTAAKLLTKGYDSLEIRIERHTGSGTNPWEIVSSEPIEGREKAG